MIFLDAQMHADGRWVIPVGNLSPFVKTDHTPVHGQPNTMKNKRAQRVRCKPYMKVTSARKIAPIMIASSSKLQLSDNATLLSVVGVSPNR